VSQVERPAGANRASNDLTINVELALQRGDQIINLLFFQLRHEIHILGRARHAVKGARHRTAYPVNDAKLFQRLGQCVSDSDDVRHLQ
jgi:hypothetical protein